MIPTAHLVAQFQYNIAQLIEIAESVDREHWASQPGGVRNHVAWTLAHCAGGNALLLGFLGKPTHYNEAWSANTGNGSAPTMDRTDYPADADLIDILRKQAGEVTDAALESADLGAAMPHESMREFWPTVGHAVAYMLTDHLADHKGQLLAWRRALRASLEHD